MNIGVAFSGGGIHTASATMGILDGLKEIGIIPAFLCTCGTSSLGAAFYLSGCENPCDKLAFLLRHRRCKKETKYKRLLFHPLRARKLLKKTGEQLLSVNPTGLCMVCTDECSGKTVLFTNRKLPGAGDVISPSRADLSIPLLAAVHSAPIPREGMLLRTKPDANTRFPLTMAGCDKVLEIRYARQEREPSKNTLCYTLPEDQDCEKAREAAKRYIIKRTSQIYDILFF